MQTDKIWDKFHTYLSSDTSPNNKFRSLILSISQITGDESLSKLSEINIETENQEMADRITEFVADSPIPNTIKAFWIGIFQYENEKNEIVYGTHIVGCNTYASDDVEWACDPAYIPYERYFTIEVVNDFFQQIPPTTEEDVFEVLDWIIPIAISSFNYKYVIESLVEKNIFLPFQEEIHFSCGYDSGDYIELLTLKKN